MLIDSNLIIYATQPPYASLRGWLVEYATHYSAISRLETLGYHRLDETEKQAIMAVLDNLDMLMMGTVTIKLAVALRQQRKISVGDALIAATGLEYQLPNSIFSTNHSFFLYKLMTTFEQALDMVDGLPLEQQELLIDILKRRTTASHRQELARTSQEALAEFRAGILKSQTASEAIAELQAYLDTPENE